MAVRHVLSCMVSPTLTTTLNRAACLGVGWVGPNGLLIHHEGAHGGHLAEGVAGLLSGLYGSNGKQLAHPFREPITERVVYGTEHAFYLVGLEHGFLYAVTRKDAAGPLVRAALRQAAARLGARLGMRLDVRLDARWGGALSAAASERLEQPRDFPGFLAPRKGR